MSRINTLRDETFYYQYEQNGGTMVMPKEVFWELYNDSKDEIERLNNILNELEKFVEKCNEYNSKCNSTIYEARAFEDRLILYKIKELKGEDKE